MEHLLKSFLGVILMTVSVSELCSVEWQDDLWIGQDFAGRDYALTEVVVWHLPGGTEGTHENPVSMAKIQTDRFQTTLLQDLPAWSESLIVNDIEGNL